VTDGRGKRLLSPGSIIGMRAHDDRRHISQREKRLQLEGLKESMMPVKQKVVGDNLVRVSVGDDERA
jgi:hypothetical protein